MTGGGGPTATDLDRALQWPKECTEEVTRDGQSQPCEKPAVALRIDPTDGLPYAVCARHARAVMVPLAAVAARLVAERERADKAKAESAGNARGLLYWNRRYVETERQAAVDVADRDKWRERAATAEREVERLRGVNADEGHRVRTLQRLKQVADRAAESAEERATEAEQSFRNATEVVITLSARVSAAEAALTEIVAAFNEHGHVPPLVSHRQHESLMAARAVLDTKETDHD